MAAICISEQTQAGEEEEWQLYRLIMQTHMFLSTISLSLSLPYNGNFSVMKSIIKYDSIHNFNSGHRHLIDGPPRKLYAGHLPLHTLQHMLLYIQQS